jgi:glycosyltransferase involved in cell wall biosynthesis
MSVTLFLDTSCITATGSGTARYARALGHAAAQTSTIVTAAGSQHSSQIHNSWTNKSLPGTSLQSLARPASISWPNKSLPATSLQSPARPASISDPGANPIPAIPHTGNPGSNSPLPIADQTDLPVRPSYHHELNIRLLANRPDIRADAALFPNYFIPPGWPYPAAATIHDVSFLSHPQFYSRRMRTYYKIRIRHTLRHATLILTVSEQSKREIVKWLGVDSSRILVHPPSPPVLLSQNVPIHREPYLLYIGNLEPKKNTRLLLESFARFRQSRPDVSLVLTGKLHGPSTWNREIMRLMSSIPGVTYAGYTSEQQLNDYLAYASALVLVSHIEGFGLSVMDALANDIPVLISRDAALCEVTGGRAVMCDQTSQASISTGMMQVLEQSRADMSGSRQFMMQRFGPEACIHAASGIIERLVPASKGFYFNTKPRAPQPLKTAILKSVAYADVFNSGICRSKLYLSLAACRASRVDFNRMLDDVLLHPNTGPLKERGRVVSLKKSDIRRGTRLSNDSALARRSHVPLLRWLAALSWVRGLYFSGGTVHGSGLDSNPDLDMFVVSSTNRVWLTYLVVRFMAIITGRGNSLCTNYLVDESAMEIHWQRDSYTAFQLLFLRKVVLKSGTRHLRSANPWVYDHFPNSPQFGARGEGEQVVPGAAKDHLAGMRGVNNVQAGSGYFKSNQPVPSGQTTSGGLKDPQAGQLFMENNHTASGGINNHHTPAIPHKTSVRKSVWNPISPIMDWLNILVMLLWGGLWNRSGLRSGTGGLLWDAHRIKLHTKDHRPYVKEAYRNRLKALVPASQPLIFRATSREHQHG